MVQIWAMNTFDIHTLNELLLQRIAARNYLLTKTVSKYSKFVKEVYITIIMNLFTIYGELLWCTIIFVT